MRNWYVKLASRDVTFNTETEFAIRQDILVRGGEAEEGTLFVDDMLIATNDSENRRNEEGELNNSVYVSRATAGDKTLKNA
jgi:hypothetical protein